MGFATLFEVLQHLAPYLGITFWIIGASALFVLVFGSLISLVHFSHSRVLELLYNGFVSLMRATPVLLLLMLVFYGMPLLFQLVGIDISWWAKTGFAILAIGLENSAYFSENLRSAYASIPQSQYDACTSLHFSRIAAIRRILGPQVFAAALPNIGNTLITIVKNSAYVYVIGITDLYEQAQIIAQASFGKQQVVVFIALSLIYWAICAAIQAFFTQLERRRSWSGGAK